MPHPAHRQRQADQPYVMVVPAARAQEQAREIRRRQAALGHVAEAGAREARLTLEHVGAPEPRRSQRCGHQRRQTHGRAVTAERPTEPLSSRDRRQASQSPGAGYQEAIKRRRRRSGQRHHPPEPPQDEAAAPGRPRHQPVDGPQHQRQPGGRPDQGEVRVVQHERAELPGEPASRGRRATQAQAPQERDHRGAGEAEVRQDLELHEPEAHAAAGARDGDEQPVHRIQDRHLGIEGEGVPAPVMGVPQGHLPIGHGPQHVDEVRPVGPDRVALEVACVSAVEGPHRGEGEQRRRCHHQIGRGPGKCTGQRDPAAGAGLVAGWTGIVHRAPCWVGARPRDATALSGRAHVIPSADG